ncbi:hypothetical protein HYDPIDRAFT_40728 [Hydnomerulius pinastri MD-312]|uniref:Uncharacterized protein n=1 Tax=Hydnomerulius pinastri MD-312 TaxID=994086 RepID=A0A0C9VEU8_9AGAM|nr:hypothetical protein HYDPIDRAFT_40728 [Hydnomerulius pinastri MD-312]
MVVVDTCNNAFDDIESNDDQAWKDAILRHHNMENLGFAVVYLLTTLHVYRVLFKHERGRNAGSGSHSDGHHSPASKSSSDPFLVKMRAQAMLLLAHEDALAIPPLPLLPLSPLPWIEGLTRDSLCLYPGPLALIITPPPSSPRPSSPPPPPPPPSPPKGREPLPPPLPPKLGPQGVQDLSELSELDEDTNTAKTEANLKSKPTKKAKNFAVVSDNEGKETPEDLGAQKSRKQPKRGS